MSNRLIATPPGPARKIILAILCLLAAGSLAIAIRQALRMGIDLQWSGAHLLSQGIDPWKTFLEGDRHHQLILGQQPNYLHELYVLLLPIGHMSFHTAKAAWCCANLVFLGLSVWLIGRLYALSLHSTLLTATLLCLSAPLRVTFANGQQSLFSLLCFAAAYSIVSAQPVRGIIFGLGFAKYSMAPVVVVVEAFRRRWLSLLCAGIPIFVGLLICWRITGTHLPTLLVEPLQSARIAVSPGYADVMTMLQLALVHTSLAGKSFQLTSVAGLLLAGIAGIWIAVRRLETRRETALVALFTLLCFKHLIYDYVFLAIPMAAWLCFHERANTRSPQRKPWISYLGWASLLYLLFAGTIESRLHMETSLPVVLLNGLALLLQIAALASMPSLGIPELD
jgi:hypothetical protein